MPKTIGSKIRQKIRSSKEEKEEEEKEAQEQDEFEDIERWVEDVREDMEKEKQEEKEKTRPETLQEKLDKKPDDAEKIEHQDQKTVDKTSKQTQTSKPIAKTSTHSEPGKKTGQGVGTKKLIGYSMSGLEGIYKGGRYLAFAITAPWHALRATLGKSGHPETKWIDLFWTSKYDWREAGFLGTKEVSSNYLENAQKFKKEYFEKIKKMPNWWEKLKSWCYGK